MKPNWSGKQGETAGSWDDNGSFVVNYRWQDADVPLFDVAMSDVMPTGYNNPITTIVATRLPRGKAAELVAILLQSPKWTVAELRCVYAGEWIGREPQEATATAPPRHPDLPTLAIPEIVYD